MEIEKWRMRELFETEFCGFVAERQDKLADARARELPFNLQFSFSNIQ